MTLRATISSDASIFTSTSDFGEEVTYHPRSGGSRTINVVVERERRQFLTEEGDVILPVWIVHVANDSTTGITSDELDLKNDKIALPPRDGEATKRKTIMDIASQDHGMLALECR